jgi:hypothetical protein
MKRLLRSIQADASFDDVDVNRVAADTLMRTASKWSAFYDPDGLWSLHASSSSHGSSDTRMTFWTWLNQHNVPSLAPTAAPPPPASHMVSTARLEDGDCAPLPPSVSFLHDLHTRDDWHHTKEMKTLCAKLDIFVRRLETDASKELHHAKLDSDDGKDYKELQQEIDTLFGVEGEIVDPDSLKNFRGSLHLQE